MTTTIHPQPHSLAGAKRSAAPGRPLHATHALDSHTFTEIRREMSLNFCKWDPQVGDACILAPFALTLSAQEWKSLAAAAEELDRETRALESALLDRPDLHHHLGLPRRLRKLFAAGKKTAFSPYATRVMRFDFHPTPEGWRVSEVNSDVPGGFTEASAFTSLMQQQFPVTTTAGDPATAYVDALAKIGRTIALLVAPGLMDDHQIVANLARLLRARDVDARLAQPRQLHFHTGRAFLETTASQLPVDAIVRFYQAEWLPYLPRCVEWKPLFTNGATPVANPGIAVMSESKRLPLLWEKLNIPLRAWPLYLPETRRVNAAPWRIDDAWLVKHAYSNTGESVAARGIGPRKEWRSTKLDILLHPRHWIAQKRFQTTPVETPLGPMCPCLGVYTIDGRAAGIYGRLAPRPIIDYRALDVAVLIDQFNGLPTRAS